MNFGLIEALEKALAKPAVELNERLDKLAELLQGVTAEQRRTNELLTQLVTKNDAELTHIAELVVTAAANKKPVRTPAKKEAPSDQ